MDSCASEAYDFEGQSSSLSVFQLADDFGWVEIEINVLEQAFSRFYSMVNLLIQPGSKMSLCIDIELVTRSWWREDKKLNNEALKGFVGATNSLVTVGSVSFHLVPEHRSGVLSDDQFRRAINGQG